MNDYISRQAVIQLALDGKIISTDMEKRVRDFINELPAADVQPVKRGKWIATGRKNVYGGKEIECSECHFRVMVSPEHFENLSEYEAFCCHCGVKMEEE